MNPKLKELIIEKILRDQMTLDDTVEFIWSIKDHGEQTKL